MLFEDQAEQLKEYFENLGSRITESSLFNKIYERFASFSPLFQKLILIFVVLLVLFIVLSGPIRSYQSSVENIQAFEERKSYTQKILSYAKEKTSNKLRPKDFSVTELSREVENRSQSYSIKLLPEQNRVSRAPQNSKILKSAQQKNFEISTSKANINQTTSLAYSMKLLNKSLLLTGLEFSANSEDPRYFDTKISLANLYVEPLSAILPKAEPSKKTRSSSRKFRQ